MLVTGKNNIPFIQSSIFGSIPHGFFTRKGGVSSGIYSSLNCSLRDDDSLDNVLKNRTLALEALSLNKRLLAIVKQVHGAEVITVTPSWDRTRLVEADGIVTRCRTVALGVQTADCVPVLFADPVNEVIGVAHAGWRGALAGIVQNTVQAMMSLGGKRETMVAAIGPAIAQESYEVGPEVYEMFLDKNPENSKFFKKYPSSAHAHLDLPAYVESILVSEGISIERMPYNTYGDPSLFFSCRRAQHEHARNFGGHMSFIAL